MAAAAIAALVMRRPMELMRMIFPVLENREMDYRHLVYVNYQSVIPAQAGIHKVSQVLRCYGFPPARERRG